MNTSILYGKSELQNEERNEQFSVNIGSIKPKRRKKMYSKVDHAIKYCMIGCM